MSERGSTPSLRERPIALRPREQKFEGEAFSWRRSRRTSFKHDNVGDQKARAHRNKSEPARHEREFAVEKTADCQRRDKQQTEIRPRDTVGANAADQDGDPEPESITIHERSGGKGTFRLRKGFRRPGRTKVR